MNHNFTKKITAFLMSSALLTSGAIGWLPSMSASAAVRDTTNYSMTQFRRLWNTLINEEKAKYPEMYNGQQTYWNSSYIDGKQNIDRNKFSTTPCKHNYEDEKCFHIPSPNYFYSKNYESMVERDQHGAPIQGGPFQCAGFALQLQRDIFQTDEIVHYDLDSGGNGTSKIPKYEEKDGKLIIGTEDMKMTIERGDVVRFHGHSIFVTDVNNSKVTFAQCNMRGVCEIDWDATQYTAYENVSDPTPLESEILRGEQVFYPLTVTTDFLLRNAAYIERPMISGDLNLNGKIDNTDVLIFKHTIRKNGCKIGNAPDSAYDINADGIVDEKDYTMLTNLPSNEGLKYVRSERTRSCRWAKFTGDDGDFMTSDGSIYSTKYNKNNGASYLGNYDSQVKTYTVPNSVKDPNTNKTYSVTEVGKVVPKVQPTGLYMKYIESLTLPSTVQVIKCRAFYKSNIQRLLFNGKSQLREIENEAFGESKLIQLGLSSCNNLKTIQNSAFSCCDSLTDISLPYSVETIGDRAFINCKKLRNFRVYGDGSNNCNLKQIGDDAFSGCINLVRVQIENDLRSSICFGTTKGIFDSGVSGLKLYLPNTNSRTAGVLNLKTEDENLWKNKKLTVYSGYYKFYGPNGSIVEKKGTTLSQINHP